jgi:hypothetical protein
MSNEPPPGGVLRRGLSTGRLEALSDGVYAIAITLLVLDIAVPPHAGDHLLRSLAHQWPSYLAYVVSFSTIGSSWLGHNVITEYLDRANAVFIRLNLVLLAFVAISLLLSSTLLLVLWRYAVHANLVRPDMADEEVQLLTQRLTPGLGGYVVLIVLGLFVPVIAVVGYLAIALFYIIPFRRSFGHIHLFRRRRRRAAQRAGADHQGEAS